MTAKRGARPGPLHPLVPSSSLPGAAARAREDSDGRKTKRRFFFFFFDRAARGEKLGKDSGVQTPEIGEGLDCAVFQKNPLVFYFLQRNPFSWFSAS